MAEDSLSPEEIEVLIVEISSGKTLTDLKSKIGSSSFHEALTKHKTKVDAAFKTRAIALAEEALDVARASAKDTAAPDKLLVDTIKWMATSCDPGRFSLKPEGEDDGGDHVIITGIIRKGDIPPEKINEDHIDRIHTSNAPATPTQDTKKV